MLITERRKKNKGTGARWRVYGGLAWLLEALAWYGGWGCCPVVAHLLLGLGFGQICLVFGLFGLILGIGFVFGPFGLICFYFGL
ncbi:hypothetical protein V6Z11_A04G022000 [Gossypium hirsutum]